MNHYEYLVGIRNLKNGGIHYQRNLWLFALGGVIVGGVVIYLLIPKTPEITLMSPSLDVKSIEPGEQV